MPALRSDSPLQYLKGVGPKRAEHFARLGLRVVDDLLHYFPFRYEFDQGEVEIADLELGQTATIRGQVTRIRTRYPGLTALVNDGTGFCTLRWFNRPPGGLGLNVGATVIATGVVREFNGEPEIAQPQLRIFRPDAVLLERASGQRRVGVYRGNPDVSSSVIRRAVETALQSGPLPLPEALPPKLIARHKLMSRETAIRQMHTPDGEEALAEARRRLAYEEFLLMELALALRRRRMRAGQTGRRLHVTPEIDQRIRARFPFSLTAAQDRVLGEITNDLSSGHVMTRLLQGDVGSGKTVVALYACLVAVANGRQAAIMAPTEILAQQHFNNIERYLEGSRTRRVLLRGKLPPAERTAALSAIERGELDLVVGTQALLQRDVAFNDLAMVVIDEQHKFGVLQRADLRTKGPLPHFLVMTATPIPRSLAMTVFGDLDCSVLDASPPGRGKVATRVTRPDQWAAVMSYVRGRLEGGEQAYVVCPRVGPSEEEDDTRPAKAPQGAASPLSAMEVCETLQTGPWRGLAVELLHGRLHPREKQAILTRFARGEAHGLVATTVVEVGVDVPNASIMIVENAERFGLSQLHQLRGRVGRGSRDSLCVLVARAGGEKARQRLEVMAQTTDGFRIAEADLRHRGPGEFFGSRQHGVPELRFGDILADFNLLEQARQDAFELIAADPGLRRGEHTALRGALKRTVGDKLALIDAG